MSRTRTPGRRARPRAGDELFSLVRPHGRPFEIAIVVLVVANGVVFGLGTFEHLGHAGPVLHWLELSFRATFATEIVIRVLAQRRRPQNADPKPFVWTRTADDILNSLATCCRRIDGSGH